MKISAASVAFLIVAGGSSTHHASAKTTVSDYTNSDNSNNELVPKKMMRNGAISVLSDAESTSMAKLLQLVNDLTAQLEDLKADSKAQTAQIGGLKTELAAVTSHQDNGLETLELVKDLTAQVEDLKADSKAQIGGLKTELAAVTSHQDNGLETLVAGIAEQVYDSHHVNQTVVDIVNQTAVDIIQGMVASHAKPVGDNDDVPPVPPDGDDVVPPSSPNHLVSSGTLLTHGDWCKHSFIFNQLNAVGGGYQYFSHPPSDTMSCSKCPNGYDEEVDGWYDSQSYHTWGVQFWSTCK